MTAYRAIATDLDGTLLRSDGSVSGRTRAAVHAAEEAGLLVIIATGRPPRWIAPIVEQLGDRGLVVCANGATVYDPARHELVHRTELDGAVALAVVDDIEAAFPEAVLGVEQGFDFGIDPSIERTGIELAAHMADVVVAPIRSFLDRPVTKLIVRLPPPAPEGTAASVQAVVGSRALVTHSTNEAFLELSHPSVHKAATVERLLVEAGVVAAEVVAFGDMPNDLELIRWAGLGVAVANAHPVLRAAADEVTASNDDDGVALVIERVLAR
ncbi:MAG: HAD-superfamily hydrolase, subfamily [Acidimicrobiales bacterium]|nr:HAD-superfamily hydrolase, subfamily [Acidimicrobiales bacterium]